MSKGYDVCPSLRCHNAEFWLLHNGVTQSAIVVARDTYGTAASYSLVSSSCHYRRASSVFPYSGAESSVTAQFLPFTCFRGWMDDGGALGRCSDLSDSAARPTIIVASCENTKQDA